MGALEVARFGRAGEHARAGKVFDAVVLDVDVLDAAGVAHVRRVEIGGRTLPLGVGAGASITLIKRPKQKWDDVWVEAERDRAVLRSFLDHALLSASGVAADVPHSSLIVTSTPAGSKSEPSRPAPVARRSVGVARGVVRELFQGPHAYFLPCEALFVHARKDPAGPVGRWLEQARAVLGDAEGALALRSRTVPCLRPQDYPAPDEDRVRMTSIASRFGTFFRKLESSHGAASAVVRPAVLRDIPSTVTSSSTRRLDGQDLHPREPRRRAGPVDGPDDRPPALRDVHREGDHGIRARVRGKLAGAHLGSGEAPTVEQVRAGDSWTIDDRGRRKLESALHAFDASTMATIHAFCHRVLRENAFASGRCFEERQVDGREAFGRAFRDALRGDIARDPARARWLEAALRSGWSMGRLEELLWNCVRERAPIRPAFDAAALDAALAAFPADEAREPGTWARSGVGRPRADRWHDRGRPLGPGRSRRAVARGRGRSCSTCARRRTSSPSCATGCRRSRRGRGARPGSSRRHWSSRGPLRPSRPPSRTRWSAASPASSRDKRAAGRYDFDDMLSLVDEALRGPRGDALAEAMRQRWRYALIDEFQDTDETQWSIFRRAFFERGAGRTPSVLLVVGDPKQSIYRFRGADVDTYLAASEEVIAARRGARPARRQLPRHPGPRRRDEPLLRQDAPDPIFTGNVTYSPVACGRPNRALVDGDGKRASHRSVPCDSMAHDDGAAGRLHRARVARRHRPGAALAARRPGARLPRSLRAHAHRARGSRDRARRSGQRACRTRSTRKMGSSRPRRRGTCGPCFSPSTTRTTRRAA